MRGHFMPHATVRVIKDATADQATDGLKTPGWDDLTAACPPGGRRADRTVQTFLTFIHRCMGRVNSTPTYKGGCSGA